MSSNTKVRGFWDIKLTGNGRYDVIYDSGWITYKHSSLKFCPNCLIDVSDVHRSRSNRRSKKPLCPLCNVNYKRLVDKVEVRKLRLERLLGKSSPVKNNPVTPKPNVYLNQHRVYINK